MATFEMVDEAALAAWLGRTPQAVRHLRQRGRLPAPTATGPRGKRLWAGEVLAAWASTLPDPQRPAIPPHLAPMRSWRPAPAIRPDGPTKTVLLQPFHSVDGQTVVIAVGNYANATRNAVRRYLEDQLPQHAEAGLAPITGYAQDLTVVGPGYVHVALDPETWTNDLPIGQADMERVLGHRLPWWNAWMLDPVLDQGRDLTSVDGPVPVRTGLDTELAVLSRAARDTAGTPVADALDTIASSMRAAIWEAADRERNEMIGEGVRGIPELQARPAGDPDHRFDVGHFAGLAIPGGYDQALATAMFSLRYHGTRFFDGDIVDIRGEDGPVHDAFRAGPWTLAHAAMGECDAWGTAWGNPVIRPSGRRGTTTMMVPSAITLPGTVEAIEMSDPDVGGIAILHLADGDVVAPMLGATTGYTFGYRGTGPGALAALCEAAFAAEPGQTLGPLSRRFAPSDPRALDLVASRTSFPPITRQEWANALSG